MKTEKPKKGRKPIADPKQTVSLYIRQSVVIREGGYENLRNKLYQFLGVGS